MRGTLFALRTFCFQSVIAVEVSGYQTIFSSDAVLLTNAAEKGDSVCFPLAFYNYIILYMRRQCNLPLIYSNLHPILYNLPFISEKQGISRNAGKIHGSSHVVIASKITLVQLKKAERSGMRCCGCRICRNGFPRTCGGTLVVSDAFCTDNLFM